MDCRTIIELSLSAITAFTAIVSCVISCKALKQSTRAINEANRPYIAVYGQSLFVGKEILHLVVKNTGNIQATIISFRCTPQLKECLVVSTRDFLKDLEGMTIAPGQSITFDMNYSKVPDYVRFDLSYASNEKTYNDVIQGNLRVSVSAPKRIPTDDQKALKHISQSLHEIAKKSL